MASGLLNVWHRWHGCFFFLVLWWFLLALWFNSTYTQTNTHKTHRSQQTDTHVHMFILTATVMSTQQLPVLFWMNNLLIQKVILRTFLRSLLFKNWSLVEVIYLLIRFNKTNSRSVWQCEYGWFYLNFSHPGRAIFTFSCQWHRIVLSNK